MEPKISALILAAGNGQRMEKGINKLFLNINDKPVLAHTLKAFNDFNFTGEVVVVLQKKDIETYKKLVAEPYGFENIRIVEGGEDRQDSAYNGLKALDTDTDYVLIHDGARPFVTEEIIADCVEKTKESGAAITSIPAVDTIKYSQNKELIDYSPPRENLFEAQTPQGFSYPLIMSSNYKRESDYFPSTDDSSILEHLGFRPRLAKGEPYNIKITTPGDLVLAEAIYHILNS